MNRSTLKYLVMAGAAFSLAACSKDATSPVSLVTDAQVTSDVAASQGDAMASEYDIMAANEGSAALPSPQSGFPLFASPPVVVRTRTCFDVANVVLVNCQPVASIRKVVVHLQIDGSRTGTNFTGSEHRTRDLTVVRNFTGTVEISRTHDGTGTDSDTAAFNNGTITRTFAEGATDSVVGVTWNVPRANNPFPTAGKFIRNVTIHATFSNGTRSETKDVTRRIEVDFPADAQGNVVLKVNTNTCNLNLVTHVVSGCQ